MEDTVSENSPTILFDELLNYFKPKSKIRNANPLSLKRYFHLLSLTDKELNKLSPTPPKFFLPYKRIQQLLIEQFENQLANMKAKSKNIEDMIEKFLLKN